MRACAGPFCGIWLLLSVTPPALAGLSVPAITGQPQSQTVPQGSEVTLSVTASGDDLVYQWWLNGAAIPSATNDTYVVNNMQPSDAGDYHVAISDGAVEVESEMATLTVMIPPTISAIPDQITDEDTALGAISFTVGRTDLLPDQLTVSAKSSDANLIPDSAIVLDGEGSERALTIYPATNQNGVCTITVTVADRDGANNETSFTLTVNPANDPPQLAEKPHLIVEPFRPFTHTLTASDPDPGDFVQVWAYNLPDWLHYDSTTRTLSGVPPLGRPDGDMIVLGLSDGVGETVWNYYWIWTKDTISLTSAADLEQKRRALITYIWGDAGWPTNDTLASVETNIADADYAGLYNESGNLARIDAYTVRMAYGLESRVYHFHPVHGNGRLFLFHAGHDPLGFKGDDVEVNNGGVSPGLVIPRLLREGYSVLAFSMPIYNPLGPPRVTLRDGTEVTLNIHWDLFNNLELPFRFFLEPIAVALNHVERQYSYRSVYMTGLSGGGWTTTVYSALDPRIERSYQVAGSIPIYLRDGAREAEQDESGFYRIANYEELYVMAAYGRNRLHYQILNRYDSCCFYGTSHTNWVDKVKAKVGELGAGTYDFFLDETHFEHKTSPAALAVILNSLPPTFDPINDVTLEMNAPSHSVRPTGIQSATLTRTNALTLSAMSDNPALIAGISINYTSPDQEATVSFTPVTNAIGRATITVTIDDGVSPHSKFSRSFVATVRPPAVPPSVVLVGPTNDSAIEPFEALTLQAQADTTYGSIVRVEFQEGPNTLAVLTNTPFVFTASNMLPGTYVFRVSATDNWGQSATSAPVFVTVLPPNLPPSIVWSSPANGATVQLPVTVDLEVSADDTDGTVARVQFFAGSDLVGTATNAPFRLNWSPPTSGPFELNAVVTDDRGGTNATGPLTIIVLPPNQVPRVQWTTSGNQLALESSQPFSLETQASDSDGSIVRVEYWAGTNLVGMDTNPPFLFPWQSLEPGTYELRAVAFDDRGYSTSTETFILTILPPNRPPAISWLDPADNLTLEYPQPVPLEVTATDADGSIRQVQFWIGTNLVGLITNAPFSVVWSITVPGRYELTAIATDDDGASVSTPTLSLTILTPPLESVTTNALTLGATVVGRLNEPGEEDYYTFTGTAGQRLYYDALDGNFDAINVNLYTPSGAIAFLNANADDDTGPFTLTESGAYRLRFNANGDTTGDYRFRLLDFAAAPVAALDTVITNTITDSFGAVVYRVPSIAGLRFFEEQLGSLDPAGDHSVYGPNNTLLASSTLGSDLEVTPSQTGEYALVVRNNTATSVGYSFQIVPGNHAPVLGAIGDQSIDELTALSVSASAADPDLPANTLTFRLVSAPTGMSIDPVSGAITWTPTEAQGPSTNLITVQVTDDGLPPLTDTKSFTVVVNEVNSLPFLTVPPDQTTDAGTSTGAIPFTVSDPETPADNLAVTGQSSNSTLVPNTNIVFGGTGTDRTITVTPASNLSGNAAITVTVTDADGGSTSKTFSLNVAAAVRGRYLFYNESAFDGNDPAANTQDDGAIAIDKRPLLPGETASFANYASYSKGINGIMIDIAGSIDTPSTNDFTFKTGNSSDVASWTTAPPPLSINVRSGAGTNGSSRVTIVWPNNVIQKRWLQVTVLATGVTGLGAPDVFYFGNAIGESGNSAADARVNATDEIVARNNARSTGQAPIDFPYDYNRDRKVSATDEIIARNNATSSLTSLSLITAPAGAAASAPSGATINAVRAALSSTATDRDINIHTATVRVPNSGSPTLSGKRSFIVDLVGPPRITHVSMAAGGVALSWSATDGSTYRVQFKDDLNQSVWNDLGGDVPAIGNSAATSDNTIGTTVQRFYRVVRVE